MPLWARLWRGGENDGAGRRSHGREADGRPGGAQRNAAPDFARQLQKVGPMTGQPGFAAGEMRLNGSKGRRRSVRLKKPTEYELYSLLKIKFPLLTLCRRKRKNGNGVSFCDSLASEGCG